MTKESCDELNPLLDSIKFIFTNGGDEYTITIPPEAYT